MSIKNVDTIANRTRDLSASSTIARCVTCSGVPICLRSKSSNTLLELLRGLEQNGRQLLERKLFRLTFVYPDKERNEAEQTSDGRHICRNSYGVRGN